MRLILAATWRSRLLYSTQLCAVLRLVAQSFSILCHPVNCSLPGSSVHGIFLARNTAVGCHFLLRGSSQPRNQTFVSCIAGKFFTTEPPGNFLFTRNLSHPQHNVASAVFKLSPLFTALGTLSSAHGLTTFSTLMFKLVTWESQVSLWGQTGAMQLSSLF